jgi:hypothetical protein
VRAKLEEWGIVEPFGTLHGWAVPVVGAGEEREQRELEQRERERAELEQRAAIGAQTAEHDRQRRERWQRHEAAALTDDPALKRDDKALSTEVRRRIRAEEAAHAEAVE